MSLQPLYPESLAPSRIPYAPGVRAGNIIYVSGILALDDDGRVLGVGDIQAQARHVITNIEAVLKAGGGRLEDIAFNAIFLRNLSDYAAFNEVYREFFGSNPPARYCVALELVPPAALVEISSIAHLF